MKVRLKARSIRNMVNAKYIYASLKTLLSVLLAVGFGPSQQTGVELSKCHHLCACPSPHCVVYMLPPALQLGKRKVTVVLCRWCFGSSQCWCLDKGSYHFLGCQVGNVAVAMLMILLCKIFTPCIIGSQVSSLSCSCE